MNNLAKYFIVTLRVFYLYGRLVNDDRLWRYYMPKIGFFAEDLRVLRWPMLATVVLWLAIFFMGGSVGQGGLEFMYAFSLVLLGMMYKYVFYVPGQGYLKNLMKVEFLIIATALINALLIRIFFPSHHFQGFWKEDVDGSNTGILTVAVIAFFFVPLLLYTVQRQIAFDRRKYARLKEVKELRQQEVIDAVEAETQTPLSPELREKISSFT